MGRPALLPRRRVAIVPTAPPSNPQEENSTPGYLRPSAAIAGGSQMKRPYIGWMVPLLAVVAVVPLLAGTHSAAAFKKLQSLAGDWEGKDEKGQPVKTNFKSIVSNTAVLETLSPTGMEDMVTVYSLDGAGIVLVHFCPSNNQPRMRVVPAADDPRELAFDFLGATNLPSPAAGHQHHLVI